MRHLCWTMGLAGVAALALGMNSADAGKARQAAMTRGITAQGSGTTRYVSPSGSETGGYTNWATAAKTIQKAVDACSNGDTVWVTNGTYYTTNGAVSLVSGITLKSVNGSAVTTINAASNSPRCRVAYVNNPNAVLEGFTLMGGQAVMAVNEPDYRYGGGLMIHSNGLVQNCVITGNVGGWAGGVHMVNGGTLRSCLVYSNQVLDVHEDGGGVFVYGPGPVVENCTIVSNSAPRYGGGVRNVGGVTLQNCIIYFNSASSNVDISNGGGSIWLTNSCTSVANISGVVGSGNITNAPLFAAGFRLSSSSPCVDKGVNQSWMVGATDLDGNARIANGTVDMGAFEFVPSELRIVSSSSTTDGCFRLTFTTFAGVTNYQVECSESLQQTNWACLGDPIAAVTGTPVFVASNLAAAQQFYRIKGIPPPDTAPPGNVTGFSATPGNGQVGLSWVNPMDADFAGVKVLRKTSGYPSSTTDGATIFNGNGTNTTDTGLTNGTAYYYKAFSYDTSTNYSSGSTTTATPTATPDATPPGNVTNLASTSGNGQVALQWTNPTDPDFAGVRILRKTGGYPTGINDGVLIYNDSGTSVTDTGLANGIAYYYKAFSYDGVPNYASGVTAAGLPNSGSSNVTYATLYSFTGSGGDGYQPMGGLVQGTDGNFYGTTLRGGTLGYGTVFRMTPGGTVTILYSFTGSSDGQAPYCRLVQGADGNFYGTVQTGSGAPSNGWGRVFKITSSGTLTTLYKFTGGDDGGLPRGGLARCPDGYLYGTTTGGTNGSGTFFKMTPSGTLTPLHRFESVSPCNDPVLGGDGNFYGMTQGGGTYGGGSVFKITPGGTVTTLYSFPYSYGPEVFNSLVLGTDGNFYGTAYVGGANGEGSVFKITPDGTLTTLHSFDLGGNGAYPHAPLVQGMDGNFYGTTETTIFRITPSGSFTKLYTFSYSVGYNPYGALVQGTDGSFYGVLSAGGASSLGAVFRFVLQ